MSIPNYEIDIIVADAKVHSHQTFYDGDELLYSLKGGGGTDFRPVFEYIGQHLYDTSLLLYFTDLEGVFPQEEPLYNVVWVSPKEGDIPFGRVIEIS